MRDLRPVPSPELAHEMDQWATMLRAVVDHSTSIAQAFALGPLRGSPFDQEIDELMSTRRHWPLGMLDATLYDAGRYLAGGGRHCRAVADLLESREVVLSATPLVRAQLEAFGRVGWFLEPSGPDGQRIPAAARPARDHLDHLASLCFRRYSAGRRRESSSAIRRIKERRDRVRSEMLSIYSDCELDWASPGDEARWLCDGQTYSSLGAGIQTFTRVALSQAHGIYDTVSDLTHPSLITIRSLTARVKGDERTEYPWIVDRSDIAWNVHAAGILQYRAAVLVASYIGQPIDDLEHWANTFEASLGRP